MLTFSFNLGSSIPIFWLPGAKSRLIEKDPDAGKDWGQEEKRAVEDEIVGWHHGLNGHESEQVPVQEMVKDRETSMLQSVGSQRVGHDWATEQQQQIPLTCTFLWTSASLSPFSWNKLSLFSAHEGELQLILQNPKFLYPQFKCLSNVDWHLKLLISVA